MVTPWRPRDDATARPAQPASLPPWCRYCVRVTTGEGESAVTAGTVLHLEVHPTVVFKLGADLVTDDVQALIELVKNCYDADSPDARIVVETEVWTDPLTGEVTDPPQQPAPRSVGNHQVATADGDEYSVACDGSPEGADDVAAGQARESSDAEDSAPGDADDATGPDAPAPDAPAPVDTEGPVRGRIEVRDRGVGMTADAVARGWLTVSASHKREMKRRGEVTKKKERTPLGDKGLGRLGAQRLGDILEIETRPETGPEDEKVAHRLRIRWSDFDNANSLADVDLTLETSPTTQPPGTTLTVRGLADPKRWRGENAVELTRELAAMISPFGKRGFDVGLRIDDDPINLRRRHEEVRDAALLRYRLDYQDGELQIEGRISTSYFRPRTLSEVPLYQELVERDNGASFRDWLFATAPSQVATLAMEPGDDKYFLQVKRSVRLADLDEVRMTTPTNDQPAQVIDPGPFSGEVDAVALGTPGESSVFDSTAEYRNFVSAINGVRIYRDGFAVRVDSDWIGLAARWSSGTSFYNLRPENVVGYIDISARDNAQLEELTNREGFQNTPALQNYMLLISAWRKFTEDCQGLVRRQWVDYRKEQVDARAPRVPMTPASIKSRATTRQQQIEETLAESRRLTAAIEKTSAELGKDRDADLFGPAPDLSDSTAAAAEAHEAATRVNARLQSLSADYADAVAELETLTGQIDAVQEQLADAWEAVSLGITAEALTHEVHQIADRLRSRSQQVLRHLNATKNQDLTVRSYVEHVRSSSAALNRQMSHLNPALRYMRERRSQLQVSEIAATVAGHYNENWAEKDVDVHVDVADDFYVEMNEGKLSQVLDNLVLNSGYWIREQRRRQPDAASTITLRVDYPFLTVTDTGPGVDPSVEGLVFEPFVTTKGRGQGRGLGLFVVRQLLEPEGAEITLDPPTEPTERARTFRISFSNARRVTT